MKKRVLFLGVGLLLVLAWKPALGQESGYLAQKLMIENDLRKRITEALTKIIDDKKYVIDVSVELELTSAQEEQVTLAPGAGEQARSAAQLSELSEDLDRAAQALEKEPPTTMGLPIPGFEFQMEGQPAPSKTEKPSRLKTAPAPPVVEGDQVLSRTVTDKHPSIGRIKKMEISVILQEGAAPELIENIRQVIMVASRFNRARGDVLSIMTATFKERRDERSAEAVMLKNIAEKIDQLEDQRDALAVREEDWRKELERYKREEAQRRDEDRKFFQSELTKLETNARQRAFEQERKALLRADSLRLQQLNREIQDLRNAMTTTGLSETEAQQAQQAIQEREGERTALDSQITSRLAQLESVQTELDRIQGGMNNMPLYLMAIISLLAVVALVIVLVVNGRSRPRYAMPPPWMLPPRRKKKRTEKPVAEPRSEPAPVLTPPPAAPAPAPAPPVTEDQGVIQSEINDMRKAVVSMSVGQPDTATRIVREWLKEEAPPPPPEPPAAPTEPAEAEAPEEAAGKKKKKK